MSNFLIFTLVVVCVLIPFGFGVVYLLYKRTIVFPVALMVFISSMFCAIVAFAVSEYGFNTLYWAIPTSLAFLVSTNAVFKNRIQKPIKLLNINLKCIALGVLNTKVENNNILRNDELGELAKYLQTTIEGLHNTSDFANSIANHKFDVDYKLLSSDDEIGNALLNMRKSLIQAENLEKGRKLEEERASYISNGIAKFSDILRMHSDDIEEFSSVLLSELVDYVNAAQAGLFVLNTDDDDEEYYGLVGAVAYDRQKKLDAKFALGEGLVGRCAYEKLQIYMTEIPDGYINVTSGLGTANPKNLLLMPAVIDDKVYAVIEIASFYPLEKHMIKLVELISENIASSFSNLKNNENTLRLLEESKQNEEEMAAQEEELRQNIEELQATQEEMTRKEKQLKDISAKLEEQEKIIKEKIEKLKQES